MGRTGLRDDTPALRLGIGRFTADLVAHGDHVLAAAGRGVGSPPTVAALPLGTTPLLVELADTATRSGAKG